MLPKTWNGMGWDGMVFIGPLKAPLVPIREGFTKKATVLLDVVQMRGEGGGPIQNYLSPFHRCIFSQ